MTALVEGGGGQVAVGPRSLRKFADQNDCHDWDDDDTGCANCGGEGFTYGCSWDWQCDTYDEGEGACLCTRPCDWCSPPNPDPQLRAALALARAHPTQEPHHG